MTQFRLITASGLLFGLLSGVSAGAAGKDAVDFDRDIRAILSDKCFACHGPDEKERKAKLRFDRKDDAFQPLKSGDFAIVPGHPEKSALIARITTKDEDDLMPPPKSGKKLTPAQIELLQRWIAEGAKWQSHWSFVKPERPPLPALKDQRWPRNEIDYFVLARLEKEKLKPSPQADKPTLLRRATYDLTGLPPTPQEVDAFLADKNPDAYEKLVDRLLDSPRYGEHEARYWLDAARYADSHGYHIDSDRSMWKYREWVINAFNQNLPFDEFTTEQLAGDLLQDATSPQKIASGYVRCNMSTGEGGAIEDEYRCKYTFDRVETTSTIWLGLTMTCARCHTHKYDPIQQREYYGLYALFNRLDESIMDGNKPNPDPFLKLPTKEQAERQERLKKLIDEGQAKAEEPVPELDAAQARWANQWHERLNTGWTPLAPTGMKSTNGSEFILLDDQSVLVEGPNPETDVHELTLPLAPGLLTAIRLEALPHESLPNQSSARAEDGRFELSEFEAELVTTDAEGKSGEPKKLKFGRAAADSGEHDKEIAKAIDGKPDTAWTIPTNAVTGPHRALFVLGKPMKVGTNDELRVRLRYETSKSMRALGHFRLAVAQDETLGHLLIPTKSGLWRAIGPFKSEGLLAGLAAEYKPEKEIDFSKSYPGVREEIKWIEKPEFEDGKSHVLVDELHGVHGVYYLYRTLKSPDDRQTDLRLRADDLFKVWVNGEPVLEQSTKRDPENGPAKFSVHLKQGDNIILLKVVNYQGACHFAFNADLDDADNLPDKIAVVLAATGEPAGSDKAPVRDFYRRATSPAFKELYDQMARWREQNEAVEKAIPTTMIAKEADKPRDTFVLVRGEYDKKGEKVEPGVPAILPPWPRNAPKNRLGLAQWLLDPSHPLTARVTANRFWQQCFGVGIVKTVEDFGVQGERPFHPELLDWLANEFIRSGWDVKHLQRLILTSATYRQSSRLTPELLARDPENRLLARGPRFRVDAEEVRDTALFVSGLLVENEGGHSVKPWQPSGLWEAVSYNNAQKYVSDTGEGQYRRSLYIYWKRQSPPPNMLIFDAPTREYCVVRRPRTNTPLQALTLLNDPQFVEAARAFAQRIMTEADDDPKKRIIYAFRLATARVPAADEINVLLDVYRRQLAEYRNDKDAAEKLLNVGGFRPKSDLDKSELAAWTTIASMLLNLDETVTKG
ncbi:MAG TPA: PSD1 and planctomycete cytochrome C domain-containing protein [Haliangiales bacterium]|nr:PSD1 and planctomycete cytochrome C domain-containing protein [Haliangiales bacterium]